MRAAMAEAEVGDDVFGDDPSVHRLQDAAAELLGKEAALFVTSGTQANLTALLSHCQRGHEYLVNQEAHTYRWEGGGAAVLGGIQPQPIDFAPDGTVPLEQVAAKIKPDDPHFAITRLLCLEDTHNGRSVPPPFLDEAAAFAHARDLSLHLDGARLANAAVAEGLAMAVLAEGADTVSLCFSKGLGAPAGSVIAGPEEVIARARRWRKMLGGAMRQSGVLAAAALLALEQHVDRLADDNHHALTLAEGLQGMGLDAEAHTNMVFASLGDRDPSAVEQSLAELDVVVLAAPVTRLVTHLDVSEADIAATLRAFDQTLAQPANS
ncbi:MAG: low-specificity L-threonine aldolase [Acidimicrobiales bacterium]